MKRIRLWLLRRKINRGVRILDALDWNMKLAGWSHRKRRQFWKDFIKRGEVRTAVLNKLTQQ